MKLYTEEQLRRAIGAGMSIGYSNAFKLDNIIDECDKVVELTPSIELPNDEEIGEEINKLPYVKHLDDGMYNDGQLAGFELGAKWMREQILKQQS